MISAHAGSYIYPQFRLPRLAAVGNPTLADFGRDYPELYRGRVRQADDFLRKIFATLKTKGLLDDALVIITADHGERLGEHGTYFHGGRPDYAATAIPIMVYDDRGGAWPPRAPVSQIDIAPTFLRGVGGLDGPGWRGQALQDRARIDAVPLSTFEATGVIAMVGGTEYKYLCERETGAERIERIDNPDAEGIPLPRGAATAPLLATLRALAARVAGPIPEAQCRH
jgi:arylsulfatase A-like enzyme